MLRIHNVSYTHPNKDLLFKNLNLVLNPGEKIALIGNNGVGKSTVLRIVAGQSQPSFGSLFADAQPYYVPQIFGQFDHLTVAQALGVEQRLRALHAILGGDASEENFTLLAEDWTIEDRCKEALSHWDLSALELTQTLVTLSGGQKTKVFLAGMFIHQPQLILLDEPSNHLDLASRQILYEFVQTTKAALIVVSHDRRLLDLLPRVSELHKDGIKAYGGNYEFYVQQKHIENDALLSDLQSKEKLLKKAKEKERESLERERKLDSRGKAKQNKAGVARIMMNTLRNKAENSTSKLKGVHEQKINAIAEDLNLLRSGLPALDKMRFDFENSALHRGKVLVTATNLHFAYDERSLWPEGLNFQILSGERIALKGSNGSGKTTLINLLLRRLDPSGGKLGRAEVDVVYIDQDYSLLQDDLTVDEQAQVFNHTALQEHEIKILLDRFLFKREDWNKPCSVLSGGERMRLALCCLAIAHHAPDIIILDEPTNNLDIQNVEILTAAINEYQGTLIVVSHDEWFLEQIGVEREIRL